MRIMKLQQVFQNTQLECICYTNGCYVASYQGVPEHPKGAPYKWQLDTPKGVSATP